MKHIKVLESFTKGGRRYSKGEIYAVDDDMAKTVGKCVEIVADAGVTILAALNLPKVVPGRADRMGGGSVIRKRPGCGKCGGEK